MSNDLHLEADFTFNQPHFESNFIENQPQQIQADFNIKISPDKVSQLENDLNYQTLDNVNSIVENSANTINARIDEEVAALEEEIAQSTSHTFVFEQGIASDTWIINHNLDKYPSVTLSNYNGEVFEAYKEYVNENTIIVRLDSAMTGYANLN